MYNNSKKDDENILYNMLNDISTDFSEYPDTTLTRDELWKYRENLLDSLSKASAKKKRRILRYATAGCAACAALVFILLCQQPKDDNLRASGQTNHYSISSMLGVNSHVEDYALHIDENHSLKNGSVTLNSVALNSRQLSVYSTYYYEETAEIPRLSEGGWGRNYDDTFADSYACLFKPVFDKTTADSYSVSYEYTDSKEIPRIQRLFLNGQEILCETKSDLYASANGVLQDTASYFFDMKTVDFPARAVLEIWKDPHDTAPETVFEFTLTEKNLLPDKLEVKLNQTVALPDGRSLHFKKFIYNPLGLWIEADYDGTKNSEKKYGSVYLNCYDKSGILQSLYERELKGKKLIFSALHLNTLYSKMDSVDTLEFEIMLYDYSSGSGKRIICDETLKIPVSDNSPQQ